MKIKEFIDARIADELELVDEAAGVHEGFEGGDAEWCPDWLYAGTRHLVRNCDIECPSRAHEEDSQNCGRPHRYAGAHIATWDPQRVRAEAQFKRRVLAGPAVPKGVLLDMAELWREHPDFKANAVDWYML